MSLRIRPFYRTIRKCGLSDSSDFNHVWSVVQKWCFPVSLIITSFLSMVYWRCFSLLHHRYLKSPFFWIIYP